MENAGHKVIMIQRDSEVDRSNLSYEELLILIGDSLLQLADEKALYLPPASERPAETCGICF